MKCCGDPTLKYVEHLNNEIQDEPPVDLMITSGHATGQ